MLVAVLHNAVGPNAPPEDQDTLVQVEAVSAALRRLGHRAAAVPCTLDLEAMRRELLQMRPDAVFNLVESLSGADALIHLPPAVVETSGLRLTGNDTAAIFSTSHKLLAKERLTAAGLPTPRWITSVDLVVAQKQLPSPACGRGAGGEGIPPVEQPKVFLDDSLINLNTGCGDWIVKGVWEHGSRGLDDDAVLRNLTPAEVQSQLSERSERLGRPCFAEAYIEGREFVVGLLGGPEGAETLPPAEIEFPDFPEGKPRIVGYRAKWSDDCFEYHHTPRRFDFTAEDRQLLDKLRGLARDCWRAFGLGGWARVDFRVDAAGKPWILEVNANPCLSPDAGFAAMLDRASISYDAAIARILAD
jgi:D-alanine-D-alanine ligase